MNSFLPKIDWLSFTYKAEIAEINSIEQYKAFYKAFPELVPLYDGGIEIACKEDRGDRFYNRVICFNDFMRVAYRDVPFNGGTQRNMGVNVSIPAHGLEYFFSLFDLSKIDGKNDIQKMFILLSKRGCKISRLDIAFDDYEKTYSPRDWDLFELQKRIVSSFRYFDCKRSRREGGDTFYIGKRSCGKLLRVYDKNIESNGTINAIRYEFEFHGKYCEDYAKFIRNNGYVPDFPSIFSRFVCKVVEEDNNCTRQRDAKADPDFLDWLESAKLSFCEQLEISSFTSNEDRLKRATKWVVNQLMPTIKSFIRVYGEGAFWLLYNNSNCHSLDDVFLSNYKLHQVEYDEYLNSLEPAFCEN